ncbi:hypothetical protein GCM10027056_16610 [Glaciibacter psychrotolerans]
MSRHELNGQLPRAGFGDDLDVGHRFEQGPKARANELLIVGDHDSDRARPASGIRLIQWGTHRVARNGILASI